MNRSGFIKPFCSRPFSSGQQLYRHALLTTGSGARFADVTVENGRIISIDGAADGRFETEIDLQGARVLPGVIDPHVHFALPVGNRITVDDFRTGSMKAMLGGTTTVFDFTTPEAGVSLFESVRRRAVEARDALCTVFLHGTVVGWNDRIREQADRCLEMGIASFKFFTAYEESGRRTSYEAIELAAGWAARRNARIIVHAEDQASLVSVDRFPSDAFKYFEMSRPVVAEVTAIQRLAEIQKWTGAMMAIVHVSSGSGAEAAYGSGLYLETCPHYLTLTRDVYCGAIGWQFAVTPPLRSQGEQTALWDAVTDGRIHWIGSDHAPFPAADYMDAGDHFTRTPFGLDGAGTLLSRMIDSGIKTGKLSWERLAELTSENTARFYGLFPDRGTLDVGSRWDAVSIDNDNQIRIQPI
ncbi:amidohydrolase family protein [bacterium]|nr:amidohydrolase family protein [candidate division CSSED10-310 bacterium]